MFNTGIIARIVGVLLIMLGSFMFFPLLISLYYYETDTLPLIGAIAVTVCTGTILWYFSRHSPKKMEKREGFLIVTLGWLFISVFSMLPYIFSGLLPSISNALFESVSGLTTTGASVINDIEAAPKGILFWRSLTQWLGGMGIIVLTVAIFPLLGIGGVELFVAEAPGPTSDKIHPRIQETAKRLWFIYLGLTTLLCILLFFNGMSFYDAANHALTTMATGGFSTKNASIAYFQNPVIHYLIIVFMFIAGINYTIIYYSLKGNFRKVWRSDEFKMYISILAILITVVTLVVNSLESEGLEKSFRDAAFQIISIITTTGFVSADYTAWSPFLSLLFFILLFIGACAGSTSGGIKIIRHLVFFKNSFLELKRLLHPRAIIRVKIDKKIVAPRILTHILVFLLLYMILFIAGSLIMSIILADFEQPFLTAIGAVATSLGNVGPAIGQLGPTDNFYAIPALGKWVLVVLMLLGRLELFTVLILFSPFFWRRN